MTKRIDVGVLGATGTVGRRIVGLLDGHPWFRLVEIAGSPESAGSAYRDRVTGAEDGAIPEGIAGLILRPPDGPWESPLLLSALPAEAARSLEPELARRGHLVVSNASVFRLDPQVPLLIPDINPDHLTLAEAQAARWPGRLVTNPNCSVIGLTLALAPLHRAWGVEAVHVATLQSLSGAGRPGPSALDLVDNVIPHIGGEEEKLAREPAKILGALEDGAVRSAAFAVSPQVHRVPVLHGHLLAVSVQTSERVSPEEVAEVMREYSGAAGELGLPSAPSHPIRVVEAADRPQPRLDRDHGGGMTVTVGRIRRCAAFDVKFSVLVHNLVRGAAGAALLNAELCHARGLTSRVQAA